jgi:hypothetical protein
MGMFCLAARIWTMWTMRNICTNRVSSTETDITDLETGTSLGSIRKILHGHVFCRFPYKLGVGPMHFYSDIPLYCVCMQ